MRLKLATEQAVSFLWKTAALVQPEAGECYYNSLSNLVGVRILEGETLAGARFSDAAVEWVYTSAAFLFADGAV
jgi:hypothetical protein